MKKTWTRNEFETACTRLGIDGAKVFECVKELIQKHKISKRYEPRWTLSYSQEQFDHTFEQVVMLLNKHSDDEIVTLSQKPLILSQLPDNAPRPFFGMGKKNLYAFISSRDIWEFQAKDYENLFRSPNVGQGGMLQFLSLLAILRTTKGFETLRPQPLHKGPYAILKKPGLAALQANSPKALLDRAAKLMAKPGFAADFIELITRYSPTGNAEEKTETSRPTLTNWRKQGMRRRLRNGPRLKPVS